MSFVTSGQNTTSPSSASTIEKDNIIEQLQDLRAEIKPITTRISTAEEGMKSLKTQSSVHDARFNALSLDIQQIKASINQI